jgi:hypothetical protein
MLAESVFACRNSKSGQNTSSLSLQGSAHKRLFYRH